MSDIRFGINILNVYRGKLNQSIECQLGDVVSQEVESNAAQWVQHVGLASMPSNPLPGQAAAEGIMLDNDQRDVVFGSRDIRSQDIYGNLKPGETCLYAAGSDGNGQARLLLKDDGGINLYTRKNNDPNSQGLGVFISATNDSISITNSVGVGLVIDANGIKLTSSQASIQVLADGNIKIIATKVMQIDGSTIVLGSSPILTPATNAALIGPSGTLGIPSLKTVIE